MQSHQVRFHDANMQIHRFADSHTSPLCNSKCLERSSKKYFANPSGGKHIAHYLVLGVGISKDSWQKVDLWRTPYTSIYPDKMIPQRQLEHWAPICPQNFTFLSLILVLSPSQLLCTSRKTFPQSCIDKDVRSPPSVGLPSFPWVPQAKVCRYRSLP